MKKLNNAVAKAIEILDEEIADKNMVKALQPKSKVQLTPAAAWPFPTRSREVMESYSSKLLRARRLLGEAQAIIQEVS